MNLDADSRRPRVSLLAGIAALVVLWALVYVNLGYTRFPGVSPVLGASPGKPGTISVFSGWPLPIRGKQFPMKALNTGPRPTTFFSVTNLLLNTLIGIGIAAAVYVQTLRFLWRHPVQIGPKHIMALTALCATYLGLAGGQGRYYNRLPENFAVVALVVALGVAWVAVIDLAGAAYRRLASSPPGES